MVILHATAAGSEGNIKSFANPFSKTFPEVLPALGRLGVVTKSHIPSTYSGGALEKESED